MAREQGERWARQPDRIVADLNAEWDTLDGGGEVADWSMRHQSLRGCADLRMVLAAIPDDPDGVLGALLWNSAAGSLLAGGDPDPRSPRPDGVGSSAGRARGRSAPGCRRVAAAAW